MLRPFGAGRQGPRSRRILSNLTVSYVDLTCRRNGGLFLGSVGERLAPARRPGETAIGDKLLSDKVTGDRKATGAAGAT